MNDGTKASRPAGEGEVEIATKGEVAAIRDTVRWLRNHVEKAGKGVLGANLDARAVGRVLDAYEADFTAYQVVLACQQSEIASLRERLEKAEGEAAHLKDERCRIVQVTLPPEQWGQKVGLARLVDCIIGTRSAAETNALRAQVAESRLAELQQAKLSVEEQNRRLVEENARFYSDREAMRRAVERIKNALRGGNADKDNAALMRFIADRLVNVYGESPNVDFVRALRERASMIEDGMEIARQALTAAQQGETTACPDCGRAIIVGGEHRCSFARPAQGEEPASIDPAERAAILSEIAEADADLIFHGEPTQHIQNATDGGSDENRSALTREGERYRPPEGWLQKVVQHSQRDAASQPLHMRTAAAQERATPRPDPVLRGAQGEEPAPDPTAALQDALDALEAIRFSYHRKVCKRFVGASCGEACRRARAAHAKLREILDNSEASRG